eukprot:3199977-Pleurochrysis_carterae.AAC.1
MGELEAAPACHARRARCCATMAARRSQLRAQKQRTRPGQARTAVSSKFCESGVDEEETDHSWKRLD